MGISSRQGPIYFQPSKSSAYEEGWDRIFGNKKIMNTETQEGITTPKTDITQPAKRGRGRPKGSKNKIKTSKPTVTEPTQPVTDTTPGNLF